MGGLNTGIKLLLLFILLLDLSYSFVQHYNMPLDGDLAPIVVPAEGYKHILTDPLGIRVLTKGESYTGPNRFFAHWTLVNYYKAVPNLLQNFTSPVNSVYMANALAKILTQILLIVLLAWYTTGFKQILSYKFLIPAFLIFPLFQTMGYSRFMGIVDPSIVYAFYYSWPLAIMLVFYLPLYKFFSNKEEHGVKLLWIFLLTFLAFFLTLNGPLVPALIIIINSLILLKWLIDGNKNSDMQKNILFKSCASLKQVPWGLLYLIFLSTFLSMYSIGLGMFNIHYGLDQITITEYYSRLPLGLYNLITTKLGWPILIAFIIVNIILLKRGTPDKEKQQMLVLFKWILFFCLIYIILLPLGGYRWYRPNAIRYDTFIPVTLACIFIFARSSFYLLNALKSNYKLIYAVFIVGFVLLFTLNDNPNFGANSCEREQFNRLASSTENPVALSDDCLLLSWELISDPADSEVQGELIYYWNITSEKKTYYQVNSSN